MAFLYYELGFYNIVPRIGMQLNVLFCSSRSPFPVVFTGFLLGVIADCLAGFLLVKAFLLPLPS